jgi:hypothetical protein
MPPGRLGGGHPRHPPLPPALNTTNIIQSNLQFRHEQVRVPFPLESVFISDYMLHNHTHILLQTPRISTTNSLIVIQLMEARSIF